jgi:uncharacterized protein YhbP (UPF0306 family)
MTLATAAVGTPTADLVEVGTPTTDLVEVGTPTADLAELTGAEEVVTGAAPADLAGGRPQESGARSVQPWVAHAFYAWMPEEQAFVFMNNPATRHGAEMTANPHVAAAIALETRVVGRLQGLQIEGAVRMAEGDNLVAARHAYLRRFPYAAVMEQPLWILTPELMKLTDNTLGFGKKLIWKRQRPG